MKAFGSPSADNILASDQLLSLTASVISEDSQAGNCSNGWNFSFPLTALFLSNEYGKDFARFIFAHQHITMIGGSVEIRRVDRRVSGESSSNRRRIKMKMKPKILLIGLFATTLLAATSMAQELPHNEFSVQGAGFFTSDSNNNGNGVSQHSTNSGGFLISYRNYFSRIFGADISYGYSRNTQLTFAGGPPLRVESDIHQTTAAMVARAPHRVFGFRPFLLAGVGALTFNPTNNLGGTILGADTQPKVAFVYGGGADYDLGDHFAIRLAYRGLVYGRPDFGLPGLSSDTVTHTAQPTAGLVFRF